MRSTSYVSTARTTNGLQTETRTLQEQSHSPADFALMRRYLVEEMTSLEDE